MTFYIYRDRQGRFARSARRRERDISRHVVLRRVRGRFERVPCTCRICRRQEA